MDKTGPKYWEVEETVSLKRLYIVEADTQKAAIKEVVGYGPLSLYIPSCDEEVGESTHKSRPLIEDDLCDKVVGDAIKRIRLFSENLGNSQEKDLTPKKRRGKMSADADDLDDILTLKPE